MNAKTPFDIYSLADENMAKTRHADRYSEWIDNGNGEKIARFTDKVYSNLHGFPIRFWAVFVNKQQTEFKIFQA